MPIKTSNTDPWNATITFPDGSVQKISKNPRKDKQGQTQYDDTYEAGGSSQPIEPDKTYTFEGKRISGYMAKAAESILGDINKQGGEAANQGLRLMEKRLFKSRIPK